MVDIPKFPNIGSGIIGNVINKVAGPILNNSDARLKNAGLNPGAQNVTPNASIGQARFKGQDLRARLSLSPGQANMFYKDSGNQLLAPLRATDGVVWPYTPTINVTYAANYTGTNLAHTNYTQQNYSHSSIDSISLVGQFTSNTPSEAAYVLAVINFLRASTKMFYGQDNLRGTPPPVLRFSAYGAYMFNSVPVVVASYNSDLTDAYDYMEASVLNFDEQGDFLADTSMVPTLLNVNVSLIPVVTRTQTTQFSLEAYARGDLIGSKYGAGGMP